MSSIISGYNYDIFISYRQKDNKGDRWVSNFVDALKTELETTFKEDISVYFDENPHDRLQETHNVDKSLEGKLNCLIFIPILSQTYCDPKSYAWQNEFLAFIKTAENDRFGKDIKLRSGNVASRILPVRIHDLEPEDVKLFEKETGSVLRAIDFIFKTTTGVSRPLLSIEDHSNDNLNKTFYRDQINKVAHAIKEIILGMKIEPVLEVKEKVQQRESVKESREDERRIDVKKPAKTERGKILISLAIVALLIVTGIITYPKLFKRDTLKNLREKGKISVAVIPFQNMTNDTTWNVWQDGIQNELITYLTNSEELKVRQTESINDLLQSKGLTNYASITPSVASKISQKLDANIFIYGSIKQVGTTLRINAQLIDSKTQDAFKSFQIDGIAENILHMIDSLSVMVKNFLIISNLEKELPVGYKYTSTSNSPEAFRYFIYGQNAFYKKDFPSATKLFSQALTVDSNFTSAALSLSLAYLNQHLFDKARKLCIRLYEKRDQMPIEIKIRTNRLLAILFETPNEEIQYLNQLQELDDQLPANYFNLGVHYLRLYQYDKAVPEFERALEISNKWGSKPLWVNSYSGLGYTYYKINQYEKERRLLKKAEKDFPDDPELISLQAMLSYSEKDTIKANKYIEKYISVLKGYSGTDSLILSSLASIYSEAGVLNKAEESYRKLLFLQPGNPDMMNSLAYFLIDKNRKLNEGLELVDKALELSPNNWELLDTKGWGLYKQGRYHESLDVLQRSWDLRMKNAIYDHEAYLHLETAKKAVASQKNN